MTYTSSGPNGHSAFGLEEGDNQGKKKGEIKARFKRGEVITSVSSLSDPDECALSVQYDELQANVFHMYEYRSASILAFTEMWLEGDSLHIRWIQISCKVRPRYTADW